MDLKTWLEKEKELKLAFLKLELSRENLITPYTDQNNQIFIREPNLNNSPPRAHHMTLIEHFFEHRNINIYLYDYTFEQLKKISAPSNFRK